MCVYALVCMCLCVCVCLDVRLVDFTLLHQFLHVCFQLLRARTFHACKYTHTGKYAHCQTQTHRRAHLVNMQKHQRAHPVHVHTHTHTQQGTHLVHAHARAHTRAHTHTNEHNWYTHTPKNTPGTRTRWTQRPWHYLPHHLGCSPLPTHGPVDMVMCSCVCSYVRVCARVYVCTHI